MVVQQVLKTETKTEIKTNKKRKSKYRFFKKQLQNNVETNKKQFGIIVKTNN